MEAKSLGHNSKGIAILDQAKIPRTQAFCHPDVISSSPELFDYYRNVAAMSSKGIAQVISIASEKKADTPARIDAKCNVLNRIISEVIVDIKDFSIELARQVLLAEIGTQIQGTWVNLIGKGAASAVSAIIYEYCVEHRIVEGVSATPRFEKKPVRKKQKTLSLSNAWKIVFSSEPDVAVRDQSGQLRIAIEIKGSMDRAGAQTRLGEAKKSFAKAKAENPHCVTMYLASCYTTAVVDQLKKDREIDKWFNLVDILGSESSKARFLSEIFHYYIRIT